MHITEGGKGRKKVGIVTNNLDSRQITSDRYDMSDIVDEKKALGIFKAHNNRWNVDETTEKMMTKKNQAPKMVGLSMWRHALMVRFKWEQTKTKNYELVT